MVSLLSTLHLSETQAEAIGNPNWVQCPEDEDRDITEFNKNEDIQLEKYAIGTTPAK